MRTSAVIVAVLSVSVAGCASDASSLQTAPLSVVRVAQSSLARGGDRVPAASRRARAVIRRSGVTARSGAGDTPTPPGSPRRRTSEPARALAVSATPGLAGEACEQYVAARAGRYPAVVLARGEARALAVVTESVAAALLGMPVDAPASSLAAREKLDEAHDRLVQALAAGDGAAATAIATGTHLRAYAQGLGIADCG